MTQRIKIGIIGTGKHGSRYVHHLINDLGGYYELTAISRRSKIGAEQAEQWHTKWYHDWRDLVADKQVDGVIAVTPPNQNYDIAAVCAEKKKPLLIEKPLATDYPTAKKMVALFDANKTGLTVGQTLRYNSVMCALKENFSTMGRLYSLIANQRLEPSSHPWLENPQVAGGGVIFHTAVHIFDGLRFITGLEPVRIRGSVRSVYNPNLEDLLVAEMEFEGGALAIIDTSKVGPARSGRYEFVCENGLLQGDQVHGILQRVEKNQIQKLEVSPPGPAILPLLRDWHSYLSGEGGNPISGGEGLAAVKICHACRLSVETGNWVALDQL